uniref:Uncharacterized protein n=1 Tax=Arundo donax TaxID=35708 RepID=A0A0A9AR92_ARUDO
MRLTIRTPAPLDGLRHFYTKSIINGGNIISAHRNMTVID